MQEKMMIVRRSQPINARHSNDKKRKLQLEKNCLPGGKKMDRTPPEWSDKNVQSTSKCMPQRWDKN